MHPAPLCMRFYQHISVIFVFSGWQGLPKPVRPIQTFRLWCAQFSEALVSCFAMLLNVVPIPLLHTYPDFWIPI